MNWYRRKVCNSPIVSGPPLSPLQASPKFCWSAAQNCVPSTLLYFAKRSRLQSSWSNVMTDTCDKRRSKPSTPCLRVVPKPDTRALVEGDGDFLLNLMGCTVSENIISSDVIMMAMSLPQPDGSLPNLNGKRTVLMNELRTLNYSIKWNVSPTPGGGWRSEDDNQLRYHLQDCPHLPWSIYPRLGNFSSNGLPSELIVWK